MLDDIFNVKFKIQVKESKLFVDKTKEWDSRRYCTPIWRTGL